MGAALNTASAVNAYVLADRGTWISFKNREGAVFPGRMMVQNFCNHTYPRSRCGLMTLPLFVPPSSPTSMGTAPARHGTEVGPKAQDLVVEAVKVRLSLGDQLRLEAAAAVARDRNLDLAILGQDRL